MVCAGCHKALGGGSALSLGTTGEFKVPMPDVLAEMAEATGEHGEKRHRVEATGVCAWCGKLESDVKKLLGRAGTSLCNECVSLACDIMEAELGPTWR